MLITISQTLAYIYHAYHHVTNSSIHLLYSSSHMTSYHGRIKQTCCNLIHVSSSKQNHIQINACSCECMSFHTYLTASQHLQYQCLIILMHVHGIKARNKKKTLIQHVKDKQTTKQRNGDLESIKRDQTKAYDMEETKKHNQENSDLGFLGTSMHAHTQACVHRPIIFVRIL